MTYANNPLVKRLVEASQLIESGSQESKEKGLVRFWDIIPQMPEKYYKDTLFSINTVDGYLIVSDIIFRDGRILATLKTLNESTMHKSTPREDVDVTDEKDIRNNIISVVAKNCNTNAYLDEVNEKKTQERDRIARILEEDSARRQGSEV